MYANGQSDAISVDPKGNSLMEIHNIVRAADVSSSSSGSAKRLLVQPRDVVTPNSDYYQNNGNVTVVARTKKPSSPCATFKNSSPIGCRAFDRFNRVYT